MAASLRSGHAPTGALRAARGSLKARSLKSIRVRAGPCFQ
jgi:hypothetical protein